MEKTAIIPKDAPADLVECYRNCGQEHVFRFWADLGRGERDSLVRQLRSIDPGALAGLIARPGPAAAARARGPAPVIRLGEEPGFTSRSRASAIGRSLLAAGKVGIFLVAGGQGSRLGFEGPKGCLPVGPVSGKTLFQLHAEKILALSAKGGTRLPWYIMTSPANDEATRSFFERHGHFGLRAEDVFFLPQRMVPALDDSGKLILETRSRIFLSPNGHGGAYEAFRDAGCIDDAERRGLDQIFYFQVDNPLIRIADPLFLGLHSQEGAEMSLKVLQKTGPEEKIGVVVVEDGVTRVIEYSDLSPEEARRPARAEGGGLAFWAGSIAIHTFSFPFFRRVCEGGIELPLHVARKKVPSVGEDGRPTEVDANKFETFVFDALPFARKNLCLEVRREEEFAPIKNRSGVDSLESAQALLVAEHRRWLEAAGIEATGTVEISPLAALDEAELGERLDHPGERRLAGRVRLERDPDGKVRAHAAD